jgi:protocatechuate 3,4-dioxygenase beta subunit
MKAILLCAVLALSGDAAIAQARIGVGTSTISGRVVDRATEQPIAGAVVTLATADAALVTATIGTRGAPPGALVAQTGADGRFVFEGIAAGEYRAMASSDGYLTQVFDGGRVTAPDGAIRIGPREARRDIDFALLRAGSISGRVFDQNGTPVRRARVGVLRVLEDRGAYETTGAHFFTNAAGEYVIVNLVEGTYRIVVISIESPSPGAATTWFQRTYYPGTVNVRDAGTVRLEAGDAASNIDIAVAPTTLFSIAGHLLRGSSDGRIEGYVLFPPAGTRTLMIRDDGAFTLGGLLPGRITIVAAAAGSAGQEAGALTVELTADLAGAVIPLLPTGSLSGRVATEDGSALPDTLQMAAVLAYGSEPVDPLSRNRTAVAVDGTFTIGNLFGDRVLRAIGLPAEWAITRVLRGRDVVDSLRIESGTDIRDLTVVLGRR